MFVEFAVLRCQCQPITRVYSVPRIEACNDAAFHSNVAQFSIVQLFVAAIELAKSYNFPPRLDRVTRAEEDFSSCAEPRLISRS